MENGPFIVDFPIKTSIDKGFSMAMLNNQMVITMMDLKLPTLLGGGTRYGKKWGPLISPYQQVTT